MQVLVHAVSRLVLGHDFRNIQASWVKEGLDGARELLSAGVNDLGGTLINESISTAAGAAHGQLTRPSQMRTLVRSICRTPVGKACPPQALHTHTRVHPKFPPSLRRLTFANILRLALERSTLYDRLRVFTSLADDPVDEPLDKLSDENASREFGSYVELSASSNFRYR